MFIFSEAGAFIVLAYMIIYVFFSGNKKRRYSKSYSPSKEETESIKLHNEMRQLNKKYSASLILSGDLIEKRNGKKRKIRNTALEFTGRVFWVYQVDDYDSLRDGTTIADLTSIEFEAEKIGDSQVFEESDNRARLIICYDDPEYDDDLIFEFHGCDAYRMALTARKYILEKTLTSYLKQYN